MASVSVQSLDPVLQERIDRYRKLTRVLADNSKVRAGETITTTDIIAGFGKPVLFQIECDQVVYDPAQGVYAPTPDGSLVRTETWMYKDIKFGDFVGTVIIGSVNGEVISVTNSEDDLSTYTSPEVDPRRIGCDQPREELEAYLPGTLVHTTVGTETESQLQFGAAQLQMEYFQVSEGHYLAVVYVNDKMRALSTQ
jgi:hypothetical protein